MNLEIFTKLKKVSVGISLFGFGNDEKYPIYVSKNTCVT